MDVEMELNGHLPPFKSSSDFDSNPHDVSNFTASMSSTESALSSLPSKPLVDIPPSDEPAPVRQPSDPQQMDEVLHPNQGALSLPSKNGYHASAPALAAPINGTSSANGMTENSSFVPQTSGQAELIATTLPSSSLQPAMSSEPASSFDAPSSIPSMLTQSLPEPTALLSEVSAPPSAETDSILNQAPTSDLRTSLPPPGVFSSDDVMHMRAEKEQHDIASDPVLAQSLADNTEPIQRHVSPVPEVQPQPTSALSAQDSMVDEGVEMDTSFDTPPIADPGHSLPVTRSPPPAPQPAPAVLPSEQPREHTPQVVPPAMSAEQPLDPAPTPVEPEPKTEVGVDQPMADVMSPPVKIAREREEDADADDSEPLAKRAKTEPETDQAEFKMPDAPSNAHSPGLSGATEPTSGVFTDADDSVTQPRLVHMKKIISNLKKSNASALFRLPVDVVALKIPTYNEIIRTPMDLSQIDAKLKRGEYSSVHDFVDDFELIVNNSITFNGREHGVSQMAMKMQNSFNNQMASMPKAGVVEPSKEEKRAQKLKAEATRVIPQRRPSISTTAPPPPARTGTARSPSAATPAQTFAVGPEGVPLIRRDSTVQDGRPKRAIIPTKRNSEFGSSRPKKKKYELQLKFCAEVLKELRNPKHWQLNQFFMDPVDPVALNIPTYFQVIKKPMDFSTIQGKLDGNVYEKSKDFEEDIRLVFKNCYKFNPEGEWVNQAGHKMEEMFDRKWETKDDWIASREPTSEPQSGGEDSDEEDAESEDDEEEEDSDSDDRNQKIVQLQKQIEAMSKQMGELAQPKKKKKSTPPMPVKKSKSKATTKKSTQGSTFPNLKPKDKKKSSSKPKSEKEKYVNISFAEKQYISNGISQLPDKQMTEALKIIQQNVPRLQNTSETEIELDIEDVPNHVLQKLLVFVKKYAGPPPEDTRSEVPVYAAAATTGGSGRPKKNKPMSKVEQEAQIEELKGKLGQYASGVGSPDALQSIENGTESSDDEADSEESEEE